jgi:multidrug efflux pump subunit AcrB
MLFLEYGTRSVHHLSELIEASSARLKPIMITTLSTVLALVPILFTDNRIQVNLSATLILGLLFSTSVTLLYLPMLYGTFFMKCGDP